MDTTPVMRRSRSKLSRRDRNTPSQMSTPGDRRTPSEAAFSTPLRAPPVDSVCWDSPVSPFSPPLLSQTCEVYWEDEAQRRTVEELKRAVNQPGDRVPPLPLPLAASPAPLLPAGRRRMSRATRQQQQQLMALLERAETLCGRPSNPDAAPTAEADREQAPPPPPPTECTKESDTSGALPTIDSDPELDRSMLRCTQEAERAVSAAPVAPADAPGRRAPSFNADVMDAMPDDEDDIFSQIPDEALNGVNGEVKSTASESSSGVSSGSSALPRPAGRGRGLTRAASASDHRPPGRAAPTGRVFSASQTTASRASETLPRIAESANSSGDPWGSTVMKPAVGSNSSRSMSRSSTGFSNSAAVTRQSVTSSSSDVVMKTPAAANSSGAMKPAVNSSATRTQGNPARGSVSGAAGVAASIQRLPDGESHRPAATVVADPVRQKAEMNRRRAQALRRLRENQRARSSAVRPQTR